MFGRIVGSNDDSKLTISIDDGYKEFPDKVKYPPMLTGQTTFFSSNGTYNVSGVILTGAPGQNYSLNLASDAVDYSIPSNKEYKLNLLKMGIENP